MQNDNSAIWVVLVGIFFILLFGREAVLGALSGAMPWIVIIAVVCGAIAAVIWIGIKLIGKLIGAAVAIDTRLGANGRAANVLFLGVLTAFVLGLWAVAALLN
jgi:hypothetical protein